MLDQTKFLVVGDIIRDVHLYCKSTGKLSPEAPVPLLSLDKEVVTMGGAGNVYRILYDLQHDATLLARFSGLNASLFRYVPEALNWIDYDNTTKTRIIVGGQHFARIDDDIYLHHDPFGNRDWLPLRDYDAIIISDYAKGFAPQFLKVFRQQLLSYKDSGKPIIANLKNTLVGYDVATHYIVNEHEYKLFNEPPSQAALFVTYGGDGVKVLSGGVTTSLAVPAVPVVDVSGCGDAFVVGVAEALTEGLDPIPAAQRGIKYGSLVVQKEGVSTLTPTDINSV